MATIVTRAGKGSSLTYNEADSNFINLNNDKLDTVTGGTVAAPVIVTDKVTVDELNVTSQTASRVAIFDANKDLLSSSVTLTTLGYLDATSSIQTQLNNKLDIVSGGTVSAPVVISANSASDALRITQTGAGAAIRVEDSANPDASPFIVDAAGNVGIGNTPTEKLDLSGAMRLADASGNQAIYQASTVGRILITSNTSTGLDAASIRLAGSTNATNPSGIQFYSGGAFERMRIDSSGNVGIGTTSPAASLEVENGTGVRTAYNADADDLAIDGPANTGLTISSANNAIGSLLFADNDSNLRGAVQYTHVNNALYLSTDGNERLRIDSSGNVGIGITNPNARLDTAATSAGSAAVLARFRNEGTTTNTAVTLSLMTNTNATVAQTMASLNAVATNTSGSGDFFISTSSSGSLLERLRITSAGLVGINTTQPTSSFGGLDIASGGLSLVLGAVNGDTVRTNAAIKIARIGGYHYTNTEEPVSILFVESTSTANNVCIGGSTGLMNAATSVQFYTAANTTTTNGTERMRIDSSGNVGIGVTIPEARFHLASTNLNAIFDYYAVAVSPDPSLILRGARGTQSAPTAVLSGDSIGILGGRGYGATGFASAARVALQFTAAENWTDTAQGTNILFLTTPIGAVTRQERLRIDSSGQVLIGTTTATNSHIFLNAKLAIVGEGTGTSTGATITGYSGTTTTDRPLITLQRSRGTASGSFTAVASGDALGSLIFRGTDGGGFAASSQVRGEVDGTVSTGVVPGRLAFYTSNTSGTSTERMRIDAAGNVGIGVTSPAQRLDVSGTIASTGFKLVDGNQANGKVLTCDSTGVGTWQTPTAGSGGLGINYVTNPSAETNTTGWNTYADAAGAQPVDGTGGTPAVTWTRVTSSPLRGTAEFNFAKDAVNRQGQGVSTDLTIDLADQAKVLTVAFDYDVISGTYSTGDLTVYLIQDPAGTPVVIQPTGFQIQAASVGTRMKQIATFQTASTGTSYRLCFHVASTSASAYTLGIDNVVVGPQTVQYGAPVTDWQSYTPTGSWVTNSTYSGKWARVGDSMHLRVRVALSGAPTATALTINLPTGYSIDTTKLNATTTNDALPLSSGSAVVGGAFSLPVIAFYSSVTAVALRTLQQRSTDDIQFDNITSTLPGNFTSGDFVETGFAVPILGWSSTVQMSNDTDTRVVAAIITGDPASASSGNPIIVPTVTADTHGAYNGTTGRYTVPVPGFYKMFGALQSASTATTLTIFKNAVSTQLAGSLDSNGEATFSGMVQCIAGDIIDIRPGGTVDATSMSLNIERLSGPSAIAASETVAARYLNTSGQTVTQPTVTILNYAVADYDTHGAVTVGASWKFTAPISGKYSITGMVITQNATQAAGNRWFAQIFKNGSYNQTVGLKRFDAALTASVDFNFVGEINLLAGDYIDLRIDPNVTASLSTTSGNNWIAIKRIGN